MLRRLGTTLLRGGGDQAPRRSIHWHSALNKYKISILGSTSQLGQILAFALKNDFPGNLALYDAREEQQQEKKLRETLEGSDLVIIPDALPAVMPGLTWDDLCIINARIIKSLCPAIARYCPNALVNILSYHLNSTVPFAAEVLKRAGTYDEKKLMGVTRHLVILAKNSYSSMAGVSVADVDLPVVGGITGVTILPLFSQATPVSNVLSDKEIAKETKRLQEWGPEVMEENPGEGFAAFSLAGSGANYARACINALDGVRDIVECSFVQSSITELPFFASKVRLGRNGVEEVLGLGPLSEFEKQGLENLKGELKSSIEKGIKFANKD